MATYIMGFAVRGVTPVEKPRTPSVNIPSTGCYQRTSDLQRRNRKVLNKTDVQNVVKSS